MRVSFSSHANERVLERVAPLVKDNPFAVVRKSVVEAHRNRSYTRKPPWWFRGREIPKGNDVRYVRTSINNHKAVIVVALREKYVFVITVITRSYATV